jgi:hypothetical protein
MNEEMDGVNKARLIDTLQALQREKPELRHDRIYKILIQKEKEVQFVH